jgi:hypothetical protein
VTARLSRCVFVGGVDTDVPRSIWLEAGDKGRQEMDAVAIQVASGAVVVLGRSWVGMSSKDLGVAGGTPASKALVIAACLNECGLM